MRGNIGRWFSGACCAWALLASTALAIDYTWNVNGPTNGWSQDSLHKNWNAGVAFPNSNSIDVFFGSVADAPIFVTGNMFVRNFTFGSSQVITNSGGGTLLLHDEPTRVITVTNAADTAVIDTTLNGNYSFTKAGPGTLSLGGTNTIPAVRIDAGTLRLTNGQAANGAIVNPGAVLQLDLAANVMNGTISGAGTIEVIGTSTSIVELGKMSTFQGTINVNATGTGKFQLRSSVGANAVINVANGSTIQVDGQISTPSLSVGGTGNSEGYGALRVDSTLAGIVNLQGPTTFSASSSSFFNNLSAKVTGNYPLTTASAWGRTIAGSGKQQGYLVLSSPDSDYPSLTIDHSDAVILVGADATLVGGVVQKGPLGTGTVSLKAGMLRNGYSGSATIDNPLEITGTTANKTLGALSSPLYVRSNITGNGNVYVTSDLFLSGGVTLSGDNSGFTGTFTVGPAGQSSAYDTIVLNSTSSGSSAATWDIRGRLNLGFAGDGTVHLGALAGDKTADIQNTQLSPYFVKTLRVGALNTDTIYRGEFNATLREPLNLVKVGTGTLRMVPEETSTLTNTVIESGKLIVNTASSTFAYFNGPVTVNANTTLGGTATMNSVITVNSGGTLAPGDGVGTLTTMAQVWAGGTRFEQQTLAQGGSIFGTTFDVLLMNNGGLNLTAVSAANPVVIDMISMLNTTTPGLMSNWDPNKNATWQGFVRITLGGTITGFSADKFVFDTSQFQNPLNGSFSVVQVNPIQLNLVYTANPIPEPSMVLLLAGSGAGLMVWRRSKRKSNATLCL